jgi:hypothetical protein
LGQQTALHILDWGAGILQGTQHLPAPTQSDVAELASLTSLRSIALHLPEVAEDHVATQALIRRGAGCCMLPFPCPWPCF